MLYLRGESQGESLGTQKPPSFRKGRVHRQADRGKQAGEPAHSEDAQASRPRHRAPAKGFGHSSAPWSTTSATTIAQSWVSVVALARW